MRKQPGGRASSSKTPSSKHPTINYGGDAFVGVTVGDWYADPATGALLDFVDVGLLSLAMSALIRRPRPVAVLISGALMVGGWSSNLLDRLGLHYWSAPGSVRGAVDFIPLGSQICNLADFCIVGGTGLFLLAVGGSGSWAAKTAPARAYLTLPARRRTGRWMAALAGGAVLAAVVGMGAAHYSGVTAPPTEFGASVHH